MTAVTTSNKKRQEGKNQGGGGTLFQKLGGVKAVRAIVDVFYQRLLADENVAPFFEGVNIVHLKRHQVEFMKVAFTQIPKDLDVPKMMIEKHRRLFAMGLNELHFDAVAGHFGDVLREKNLDTVLIEEALQIVGGLRGVFEQGSKDHGMGVLVYI